MPEVNRGTAFQSFAQSRGYEYTPEFDRNDLGVEKPFWTFEDWVSGTNLIRGRFGAMPFQMFDMSRTVTGRDADGHSTTSTACKTAFVVENRAGLPELRLMASRGIAASLFNMAGRMGVEFQPDGGFPEDAAAVRKFNNSYFADGGGFEAGMEFRETPEGISLTLLKCLIEGRGWSIEVSGDHVLIHVDTKIAPAEELQVLHDEARSLVEMLHDRNASQLNVRRLPPVGMTTLFATLLWPFFGAVLGMISTMVVFGIVFAVMGEMPTAAIFAFPFVGMGLMLGGVVLMVKLKKQRQSQ